MNRARAIHNTIMGVILAAAAWELILQPLLSMIRGK